MQKLARNKPGCMVKPLHEYMLNTELHGSCISIHWPCVAFYFPSSFIFPLTGM